jgi:hypothetical protein
MEGFVRFVWLLSGIAAIAGCNSGGELPGHYWNVTATADVDECNDPTVPYQESFLYRVVFDGQDVEVAIGDDVFATGTTSGCDIVYDTPVWSDARDDGTELRWTLVGSAKMRTDPNACIIEDDKDWSGTEIFEIVYSEDINIPQGCEYELNVTGTYSHEVK